MYKILNSQNLYKELWLNVYTEGDHLVHPYVFNHNGASINVSPINLFYRNFPKYFVNNPSNIGVGCMWHTCNIQGRVYALEGNGSISK
jgi:hypothetical protein